MLRHSNTRTGLVGALFGAILLCALPAQGQVIEEGYPTKPVFPEEPPAAPHLHEECGPFLDSDAFAEECTGDSGPDVVGIGSDGEGFSGSFLDPAFRTPPRLECPSAVFLEELETSAIDCHASDAAGEEHLDYRWEPIGGATRDYLENPRLIPEDAPNPMVVAPSSPQYEALETFLSEEGTQRYRYRLTATSRATGLSSWSEVEVFVLSSRPEVYCPLEVAVEEGATVVLACEGADPLSFRMEDGPGDAPVLWEWEGLWGASTAPLTAADTPQPLFTAPVGSAGATYHYVASMTTHSSGLARTARRRVSVAVKAAEGASAAPSITCPDSPYRVYERHGDLTLACEAQNAPEGATYLWEGSYPELLTDMDTLVTTFSVPPEIRDYPLRSYSGRTFVYDVTMSDSLGVAADVASVEVTVLERPNIRMCLVSSSKNVDEGSAPIILNECTHAPTGAPGDTLDTLPPYRYQWSTRSPTPSSALSLLSASDVYHPVFTPPADVSRQTVYHYTLTVSADNADDFVFSQDITVNDLNAGVFSLVCVSTRFATYDNLPDITLACDAPAAPPDAVWLWTPRNPTQDTDRLSATDIRNPVFDVQAFYDFTVQEKWFYYNVSVSAGSQSQSQDIVVKVISRYLVSIYCGGQAVFLEGDNDRTIGNCRFLSGGADLDPNSYRPTWRGVSTTDTRFTTIDDFVAATLSDTTLHAPTFYVPDMVDRHEQYVYNLQLDWSCYPRRCVIDQPFTAQVLDRESFDAELELACEDVEVYETGATQDIALSCTPKNVPSGRTPRYEWKPDNPLDLARLINGRTTSSPTFRAPAEVDENTTYVYKATVKAENTLSGSDIVTVTVLNKPDIDVTCTGNPYLPYEGSGNITLDCSASGAPGPAPDYTYAWTTRGSTADTDRLSAIDVASPTFDVPDQVRANETYEYTLTVSAENAEDGTADVTVMVLDKPQIAVTCTNPDPVYEGSPDITLDCSPPTGAPGSAPDYAYAWTARGNTSGTALLTANADGPRPTFAVPGNVDADTKYEYTLTVSAANAEDGTADVTVVVLDKPQIEVTCTNPASVYEGSPDITLDCSQPTGAPAGSNYTYAWTARSPTPDASLLSSTAIRNPTFAVPGNIDADTKYEYTLTVSAENAEIGTADVTVTILNKPQIVVTCTDPDPVYEGSVDSIQLDCSQPTGAPAGSAYAYVWTARSPTPDTHLLTGTDGPTPVFAVPGNVSQSTKYEYTLMVSADNAETGTDDVTVTVLNEGAIALVCEDPDPVYEGAPDLALLCSATGAPGANPAYSYVWTVRGDTPDTDLLSAADIASPTFATPDNVSQTTTYEYAVTASAANAEVGTDNVTVTVLNKPAIVAACAGNPYSAYEGSGALALSCAASGVPGNAPSDYDYAWTVRGDTPDTGLLSAADVALPTFAVPDNVSQTTTYEYLLTVMAANAETATVDITVTVLNKGALALACANPDPVYEGSGDITLDCAASGAPEGSSYSYVWSARGATTDTGRLVAGADGPAPTFQTPDRVDRDETYEYLLTVSAENAEDATADVTVTVLNKGALALVCANPDPVYEGSADIRLDCSASGAPAGSDYAYAWSARGATADTGLLSATDIISPTFAVPLDVPQTTRYAYAVRVSAANADAATSEVTVTVLNTGAIALVCRGNPYSAYEGSGDLALDCSASGAPEGSDYDYAWMPRGATSDTDLLSAVDDPAPVFSVPDNVSMDERYDYLLTVTAEAAESATAEVTVTVLNKPDIVAVCTNPNPVYEGSEDITLDCAVSGAPEGSMYEYVWEGRGSTADTDLLSAADVASPSFAVPDDLPQTTRYEYLLTVSAEYAESATVEITVTVLDKGALALVCPGNPYAMYEGSPDFTLNCSASGAPEGSDYEYAWTPRGGTADTGLLSAADVASPTFAVPGAVDADATYEYLLTVSAEHAESATAEITVTVLNKGALALVCPGNPYSAHEGSEDITLNCSASGAPEGAAYEYAWTPRGATADTDLLSAADVASPTFAVPDAVDADETYEYLLAVFANNADAAGAEVTVTVLDRIEETSDPVAPPAPDPVAPEPDPADPDPAEPLPPPVAEATPDPAPDSPAAPADPVPPAPDPVALSVDPSALGMRVGVSGLRFGAQSSDTQVSLDPLTDRISTSVSGPYHAGRMTLSADDDLSLDENGEAALSIELVTPVTLRRAGDGHAPPLALRPTWSMAASCAQRASQSIGGWHTETTLSESDCRLLLFGGELDLTDAPPGRYSGNIDVALRTASGEETHSIAAEVDVVPAGRVILAGAGGVRFGSSREIPLGLLEEQTVSIYPNLAYLTRERPSGVFELSNLSLIPLEVSVSARFGYTEATEDGRDVVVEDRDSARLGDLSEALEIHPKTLILRPGEQGVVRYGVREEALAEMRGGYAAFFEIVSFPRQYARTDWLPEAVSGGKTALVTMRVPGAYAPSEDAPHIRAELLSAAAGASPSATFLIETGDVPFAGEAVAYDADGHELGRRRTLVYTRSRVRIPFSRLPEGEAVLLRFVPSGSGQTSEPVSVPWTTPPRGEGDIGAAMPLKK